MWCRYCYGTTESNRDIEPNDPNWDRLVSASRAAKDNPMIWLEMEDIYGTVGQAALFRERFALMLRKVWAEGVERVLQGYLQNSL